MIVYAFNDGFRIRLFGQRDAALDALAQMVGRKPRKAEWKLLGVMGLGACDILGVRVWKLEVESVLVAA